jgi:hypothetical protein
LLYHFTILNHSYKTHIPLNIPSLLVIFFSIQCSNHNYDILFAVKFLTLHFQLKPQCIYQIYKFQSSNYSNFHILTIDIKVINMESCTNIDDVLHSYQLRCVSNYVYKFGDCIFDFISTFKKNWRPLLHYRLMLGEGMIKYTFRDPY